MNSLTPQPLNTEAFAPFGEVIDCRRAKKISINNGLSTRFHDLFNIDVSHQQGHPLVNLFRTRALLLPHQVTTMERHPLGSQAFIPLDQRPFLILVATAGNQIEVADLRLFISDGQQGVNLFKNTWHHFNIVLEGEQDFIVIDRGGAGENLEEIQVRGEAWIDR